MFVWPEIHHGAVLLCGNIVTSGALGTWRSSGDTPASLDGLRCGPGSSAFIACSSEGTGAAGKETDVCALPQSGTSNIREMNNSLRKGPPWSRNAMACSETGLSYL